MNQEWWELGIQHMNECSVVLLEYLIQSANAVGIAEKLIKKPRISKARRREFVQVLKRLNFQSYDGSGRIWRYRLTRQYAVMVFIERKESIIGWKINPVTTPASKHLPVGESITYLGDYYDDVEPYLTDKIRYEMAYFVDIL
jgi:hypothetical protein